MQSLLLPLIIPAAVGAFILVVPRRVQGLRAVLGVLGALVTFVAAGSLVGTRQAFSRDWLTLGELDVNFALRVDAFSSWAVGLVGLFTLITVVYAAGWYRGRGGAPGAYHGWVLIAAAAAMGVLMADDLLLMVVFWEVVTLMLFLLAATSTDEGGSGAAKAFAILGMADMALLVGVLLIGRSNTLSISELTASPLATDSGLGTAAFLLLLVAASAKAGAMPFHSWIPTMSTGVHSSVMAFLPGAVDKVLGIYLLVRISLAWFALDDGLRLLVMSMGAVTILGGVFMALFQRDLRRLLSFCAVSQVGYMLLGIGTGTIVGVMGGLFHMANHAIYKSCLFFCAGSVEREAGTMDLSRLGGLGRTMPLTFGAMFVGALAMAGLPPMNGFASKWLIYQSCVAADAPLFLVVALFGSVLTLACFVSLLHSVFWGPRPARLDSVSEGSAGVGVPLALVVPALLCIVLGVGAAYPLDVFIGPVVGLPENGLVTGSAALDGSPATSGMVGEPVAQATITPARYEPLSLTVLLLSGIGVTLLLAHRRGTHSRRVRDVFVGGQPFDGEVNRFSGTAFYRDVEELPGIGAVLDAGQRGRLDLYRVLQRLVAPIIGALRRLHSGLVTEYLVWFFFGLGLVLVSMSWR